MTASGSLGGILLARRTNVNEPPDRAVAANPVPFVVSDPCCACDGKGKVDAGACATCRGTGVGRFFHGTKANLDVGGLIAPGYGANYGKLDRITTYVYFTGTLDA